MTRYITALILAGTLLPLPAAAEENEEKQPVHHNRVDYGNIQTNVRAEHWRTWYPGFTEKLKGSYTELEEKADTDYAIQVRRPRKLEVYDFFVKRMPLSFTAPAKESCDNPAQAGLLELPPQGDDKKREILYSYTWLVCAGGGTLSSERLLEKYIEKYGNYDRKDYDRNQIVYYNVEERYEVRVWPAAPGENKSGLYIKVTDNRAFERAYRAWRGYIRNVEAQARDKL